MDARDIDLVRVLQNEDIFLTESPFAAAAEILGWDISEVLERSKRLRDEGKIRRFGAALTPRNAGFKSNSMVAWEVDESVETEVASTMAAHPRISHCYIRPCFEGFNYNVYTMIHASTPEDLRGILDELSAKTGVTSYRALNSLKEFKKSSPVYFPDHSFA